MILLILNTGQMLETGFEKILLMQNALNLRSSEVIDTYVQGGIGIPSDEFHMPRRLDCLKRSSVLSLLIVNQTAKS